MFTGSDLIAVYPASGGLAISSSPDLRSDVRKVKRGVLSNQKPVQIMRSSL